MSCNVCVKPISTKQLKLTCADCKNSFHAVCLRMSKADCECVAAEGLVWRCEPCAATRRKSMRFEGKATEGTITLEEVVKLIKEMNENHTKTVADFNASYDALHTSLQENTAAVNKQTENVSKCLTVIEELQRENKLLKEKVASLENRLEDMEQYSRANAVEIHGVPLDKNENVIEVVKCVGKALDMDVTESMIDACHRLGNKPGPNNQPPGIIVKFVRRMDKEEMLRKRRVKNNLSTRHMNLNVDQAVYVNEALSPAKRRLYALARQVKKNKKFKFLWTRGGKIFLRKEEGTALIPVTCQADLNKLQ